MRSIGLELAWASSALARVLILDTCSKVVKRLAKHIPKATEYDA